MNILSDFEVSHLDNFKGRPRRVKIADSSSDSLKMDHIDGLKDKI